MPFFNAIRDADRAMLFADGQEVTIHPPGGETFTRMALVTFEELDIERESGGRNRRHRWVVELLNDHDEGVDAAVVAKSPSRYRVTVPVQVNSAETVMKNVASVDGVDGSMVTLELA